MPDQGLAGCVLAQLATALAPSDAIVPASRVMVVVGAQARACWTGESGRGAQECQGDRWELRTESKRSLRTEQTGHRDSNGAIGGYERGSWP